MSRTLIGRLAAVLLVGLMTCGLYAGQQKAGYLGIGVESLHPSLAMHLPKTLLDGQGILITRVANNSPAAKAGLKPHEILVAYDGQKLFSPEQLVKLVHADKPGHKANIDVVQAGKIEAHTVVLSEQPQTTTDTKPEHWWQRRLRTPWRLPQLSRKNEAAKSDAWKSFDSLSLKKLDDGRFKAEVEYLDKNGKKKHHEFEGTREEIRTKIEAEKDLPVAEKDHLLRGLDLESFQLPQDFSMPFDDPWDRWNWDPFHELDF